VLDADDLEAGLRVQQRLEGRGRVAPEVPRQLVLRPGLVGGEEQETAVAQHRVDLEERLPGHGQVLERRDRVDRVEGSLERLRERVHVADDVDVRSGVDVEADVLADALQPRIDARAARTELEHAGLVQLVGQGDEVGEHRVVGVVRTLPPQRHAGGTDRLDEHAPTELLEGFLHRASVAWDAAGAGRPGAKHGWWPLTAPSMLRACSSWAPRARASRPPPRSAARDRRRVSA
jgi:hypothetical protein